MELPTFDLRLVAPFVVVAEEQHIGRAAERLFVAQPALSRQISLLEEQLGTRLFERTSRGMELTEAGKLFLDAARDILRHAGLAEAALRPERGEIAVHLGGTFNGQVRHTIATFAAAHPAVRIEVVTSGAHDVARAVAAGDADVGFDFRSSLPAGLEYATIDRQPLGVMCPAGHRLAGPSAVAWSDLAGETLLQTGRPSSYNTVLLGILREQGVAVELDPQVPNQGMMLDVYITSGRGLIVCPVYAVPENPSIAWTPLLPRVLHDVGIVWNERTADETVLRLVDWARKRPGHPSISP